MKMMLGNESSGNYKYGWTESLSKWRFVIVVLALSSILRMIGVADRYYALMNILFLLFYSGCIYKLMSACTYRCIRIVIYTSYLIRVVLSSINYFCNYIFEAFLHNTDWSRFQLVAVNYYYGNFKNQYLTNYPYILLFEYKIFGLNEYLARLTNTFFSVLALYILFLLLDYLNLNIKTQVFALVAASFAPFSIIYSMMLLREPIYVLATIAALYCFVRFMVEKRKWQIAVCVLASIGMVLLHTGMIVVLMSFLLIILIEKLKNMHSLVQRGLIFILVLGILAGTFLLLSKMKWSYILIDKPQDIFNKIDYVYQLRMHEKGNSQYLRWMSIDNMKEVVLFTPLRMLEFLISPLPFIESIRLKDLAAFILDSSIYLLALLSSVIYFKKKHVFSNLYRITYSTCLSLILLTALVYAWGTVTAGTAIRHRLFLNMICIVMISICVGRCKNKEE